MLNVSYSLLGFFTYTNSLPGKAHVLTRGSEGLYVHYIDTDKRMDEWVPEALVKPFTAIPNGNSTPDAAPARRGRKRKRTGPDPDSLPSPEEAGPSTPALEEPTEAHTDDVVMTEEDYDIQQHKQITAHRNFDMVYFGDWQIKTW